MTYSGCEAHRVSYMYTFRDNNNKNRKAEKHIDMRMTVDLNKLFCEKWEIKEFPHDISICDVYVGTDMYICMYVRLPFFLFSFSIRNTRSMAK